MIQICKITPKQAREFLAEKAGRQVSSVRVGELLSGGWSVDGPGLNFDGGK